VKNKLLKILWLLNQFGFDPIKFFNSTKGLPRYFSNLFKFRSIDDTKFTFKPCLYDWYEEGGAINNEYFWQDLIIAQMINKIQPSRHIDIGSRIDGFVSNIASFREIEIFDVRPIYTIIPNVIFRQLDFMKLNFTSTEYGKCDSLSCLHTIEHFGLGRYGDPIQKDGYLTGLYNMTSLLTKGGLFYFSTPIGKERVEFNANRVFNPLKIYNIIKDLGFKLNKLLIIENGKFVKDIFVNNEEIDSLSKLEYSLGIFIFEKIN